MKLKSSTKALILSASAFGLLALVPLANVAMADVSPSSDIIDLSVDVNNDGLSDQLLAESQKTYAYVEEVMEPVEALSESDPRYEQVSQKSFALATIAYSQLEARMPYSDNARQLLAESDDIETQYEALILKNIVGGPELSALEDKMFQLSDELKQDSSYLEVLEAKLKVNDFLSEGLQ